MWNNESELNFLKIYQTEPVLWEPNHIFHRDKKKLHDAWVRISKQTEFSVDELKRKKDSLMATYRGHLRKIQNSLKSGAGCDKVYKPIWFAFDLMNSFLGHLYRCKTITAEANDREDILMEAVKYENTEDATAHHTTTEEESSGPPAAQRRRKNPPELSEANKNMKDTISTLNKILQKKEPQEDDCDRYGKILANKLRKLSEDERLHLMYEIDGLFIKKLKSKASVKYYNVPSPSYYGVLSSSPSPMSPSHAPACIISNLSNSESVPPRPSSI